MCSGSNLYLFCILPCGMFCLSAARMVLTSMLFALRMFEGICMFVRASSISRVNDGQFAFL